MCEKGKVTSKHAWMTSTTEALATYYYYYCEGQRHGFLLRYMYRLRVHLSTPAYLQDVTTASLPNNPLSLAFLTHPASLSTMATPSRNACLSGRCSAEAIASRRPLRSPWAATFHGHVARVRQGHHGTQHAFTLC